MKCNEWRKEKRLQTIVWKSLVSIIFTNACWYSLSNYIDSKAKLIIWKPMFKCYPQQLFVAPLENIMTPEVPNEWNSALTLALQPAWYVKSKMRGMYYNMWVTLCSPCNDGCDHVHELPAGPLKSDLLTGDVDFSKNLTEIRVPVRARNSLGQLLSLENA